MRPNNGNPYAPITRETKPEDTTPVEDSESVPEDARTVKSILEWVGEDADRAVLALEQEEASDNPRKSLVSPLEDIINA